jgi:5-hydroxyisourate hydrolase-like protein (transthyretin family)
MRGATWLLSLAAVVDASGVRDNTITKVVKLLQEMLDKSKEEAKEERTLFAKFKCYCDDNEMEKKDSIDDTNKEIGVLSSKIEELQGSTGSLSSEVAKLASLISANEAARAEAESIRTKENEEYVKEKDDMEQAISQMDEAIDALADIGADQTMGDSARDNKKFMAGFKGDFVALKTTVKQALLAANSFMTPAMHKKAFAFIQAPFTGSYSSQSGEIVGILKNMRDTFKSNLKGAIAAEKSAVKSHEEFMTTKNEEYDEMKSAFDEKQEVMGANDDEMSTKKEQLSVAKDNLANDEAFLEKLLRICSDKTKDYQQRKAMRANEDAAIAEAIAILNSDAAFASFGKTDATSTGATGPAFLQVRAVSLHTPADLVQKVQQVLSGAGSTRAVRLAKKVKKGNVFEEVLSEIDNMLKLNEEEGKADKENLDWCNSEREETDGNLEDLTNSITDLETTIDDLTTTIGDPETGLKVQLKNTEDSLLQCVQAQKTETKDRVEANSEYQVNIKNLVSAQEILKKALKVLKKYYDELAKKIEAGEFIQHKREDPAPPETFGTFKGQSEKGNSALSMLEFILESSLQEEHESHSDEESAQHSYEDSMADLKAEEAEHEKNLVELQKSLADAEENLLLRKEELKKDKKDKESKETYLKKIKPGCDFITANFDDREDNRATEKEALEKAVGLIKDTPVYKAAMAEAHADSFGDCKETCLENEDHVKCKACMAKTSVPGYCAGHKDTEGCN